MTPCSAIDSNAAADCRDADTVPEDRCRCAELRKRSPDRPSRGRAGVGHGDPSCPSTRSVILACEMIDDEVRLALERTGSTPRSSGSRPAFTRTGGAQGATPGVLIDRWTRPPHRSAATVASVDPGTGPADDRARAGDRRGRSMTCSSPSGYCGNGLQGPDLPTARLVFPRVDDCISLFLNHGCSREEIERDAHAFYLTRGWLCHDNPLLRSYDEWRGALRSREGRPSAQGEHGGLPAHHPDRHGRL